MAAALAGECSSLDTVVYVCCDMLNACELVSDVDRAVQWCAVVDEFVATYGCPFLYAECRTYYGSVLITTGRWDEAERELRLALKVTDGACPALHAKALARLARLRTLQGRLEEADQLLTPLGARVEMRADAQTHVGTYRAPSVDAAVVTEVESTPLIERISDHVYRRIRRDAHDVYRRFTTPDGSLAAPFRSNIVVARR